MTEHRLRALAPCKVNLALEILGRRPDGYHDLVSVTQTVSLADEVTVTPGSSLEVVTEPPLVSADENLVGHAALLLAEARHPIAGASIALRKYVPIAAGLGGGSSDAATTLRLLDRLWGSRQDESELRTLAAALGSDVPLFLQGGTALLRGRGEVVEPLPAPPTYWLALACPAFDVPDKTRRLYGALAPGDWSDGAETLALADCLRVGGSPPGARFRNAFDRAADAIYPGFAALRQRLSDAAGVPLSLTGAGPSLFALFATRRDAAVAARRIDRAGVPTFVVRSLAGRPRIRRADPNGGPYPSITPAQPLSRGPLRPLADAATAPCRGPLRFLAEARYGSSPKPGGGPPSERGESD
ncbi:MAG: 4-(cytidine 5'-diphospho)-2-C-methyl-D-erythritol kinase [Chloroflexi bacterium]|nr:4-(cytidine 5'-diphospho)-2-C-methyl-D-erythritol kinase [Chloroflexota bacterium]